MSSIPPRSVSAGWGSHTKREGAEVSPGLEQHLLHSGVISDGDTFDGGTRQDSSVRKLRKQVPEEE